MTNPPSAVAAATGSNCAAAADVLATNSLPSGSPSASNSPALTSKVPSDVSTQVTTNRPFVSAVMAGSNWFPIAELATNSFPDFRGMACSNACAPHRGARVALSVRGLRLVSGRRRSLLGVGTSGVWIRARAQALLGWREALSGLERNAAAPRDTHDTTCIRTEYRLSGLVPLFRRPHRGQLELFAGRLA